ncbi:caspase-1-like [Augochlora pura]
MLVLLFCMLSFTRTAIVQLSNRLFSKENRQIQYHRSEHRQDTMDDQNSAASRASSTPGYIKQRSVRNSKDVDSTDTIKIQEAWGTYDDDSYFSKPIHLVKSPVLKHDTHYNMNHKMRGKCVILNHYKFEMEGDRPGSDIDVKMIENVFQDILGFDVIPYHNLTSNEITETIKQLCAENHGNSDCFCMFILTHGTAGDTLAAKDCYYPLKSIWQRFTGDNCPTLVGKPKLFFVQACRGNKYDGGVGVYSTENSETDSVVVASYKIPTHADFLIAHSTVDEFYSWRNPSEGTFYVQQLCEVIKEYRHTHDLTEMMTITARVVANEYSSSHYIPFKNEQKQMPTITSTLTRKICFTKKNSPT